MRPTPDEIVAGVRAILKQDIGPLLPASAQAQLKRVMAVLRDARWNEAGFDLLRENAEFARLARATASRIDRETGLPATVTAAAAALRAASDEAAQRMPASFVEANEVNRQLRAALSRYLDAVRDGGVTALDDLCEGIGVTLMALRAP